MEFYIRSGATKPTLKMRMVDDAKNDKTIFNELLESANIKFDMWDIINDVPEILSAPCYLSKRLKKYNQTTDEYYINYDFTSEQTSKIGRYEGKITIEFLNTDLEVSDVLILPIREKLFINIV